MGGSALVGLIVGTRYILCSVYQLLRHVYVQVLYLAHTLQHHSRGAAHCPMVHPSPRFSHDPRVFRYLIARFRDYAAIRCRGRVYAQTTQAD